MTTTEEELIEIKGNDHEMKHYVTLQIGFEDEPCVHKDGTVEFPEEEDVLRALLEYGFDARRVK